MADALVCLPKPRRRQAPVKKPRDPKEIVANRRVADAASLASPAVLYSQATSTILDPYRRTRSNLVLTGAMERLSLERFQNPCHWTSRF